MTELKKQLCEFLNTIPHLPKHTISPIIKSSTIPNQKTVYWWENGFSRTKPNNGFAYRIDFERQIDFDFFFINDNSGATPEPEPEIPTYFGEPISYLTDIGYVSFSEIRGEDRLFIYFPNFPVIHFSVFVDGIFISSDFNDVCHHEGDLILIFPDRFNPVLLEGMQCDIYMSVFDY